ncbi:MAG: SIR2 family protein [Acidobacteria bacterium]|nr:SIR2 family protein [Acidobacteriota bacterium]
MVEEFKIQLFCSESGTPRQSLELGEPAVWRRIDAHFDGDARFPTVGEPGDYSAFFEAAMAFPSDRRSHIEKVISGRSPSFGHFALAVLMALDRCRLVRTTNFDGMIEDAAARIYESAKKLTVAEPDLADRAIQALNEERWPLFVKLHGDFQSDRLKNTSDELAAQDVQLRNAFASAAQRYGLIVAGYSGRDESVMSALEESLDGSSPFPSGLYWCHYGADPPLPEVSAFIASAIDHGVDAQLVQAGTFDELVGRLLDLIDVPAIYAQHLDRGQSARRSSPLIAPSHGIGWPIIRFNGLPILDYPTLCRRIEVNIGGTVEVRAAVASTGVDVIATRRSDGVIAFGRDSDLRQAFAPHDIKEFDVAPITAGALQKDHSQDQSLLYDAVGLALSRSNGVSLLRQGRNLLLIADPAFQGDSLKALKKAAKGTGGKISGIDWCEAIRLRLEFRYGKLWLLYEPTVWFERSDDPVALASAKEFTRERLATRYNKAWNELVVAWRDILTDGQSVRNLSAYGISPDEGIDAQFTIGHTNVFSRALS